MVQVARIRKESSDVCRFTIDLTVAGSVLPTLDPGEGANYQWLKAETITGFQTPSVSAGPGTWSPVPPPTTSLPADPSPVTVSSCTIVNSNTALQLFIANGTAGYSYVVKVIVQDSVGRFVTLELAVTLMGVPATAPTPVPAVTGALPLLGGTMQGPLYLFESPLTGAEAANKTYVDAAIANGFTTSGATVTGTLTAKNYALGSGGSGTIANCTALTVTGSANLSPSTPGVLDNMVIGGVTPLAGHFTSLSATSSAVLGITAIAGAATCASTLAVTGLFSALGNATVGGTLGVTGAASMSSTLAVTGGATVGGTLGVTGTTTVVALTATGLITPSSTVGIKATATNDNAQSGSVGEYADFNLPGTSATVTMTIAAPCVVTYTGHGMAITGNLAACFAVQFTTTGALPTGLAAATTYYATVIDANTFHLSTTPANALAGTYITTTGSQSGTQTCFLQAVMASNTPNDVIAFTLPAGDWEVDGTVSANAAGTNTGMTIWTNTVSKAAPTLPYFGRLQQWYGSMSALIPTLSTSPARYSVSAPTTVFLTVQAAVSVLGAAEGFARVRRIR